MIPNFSFLFQYLKQQDINIDQNEFNFQIQSHPDYPSLLSVSDTLTFFNINNYATKLDVVDDLPDYSVALLNDPKEGVFLSFIERISSGYKYTKEEKTITVSNNEFIKLFGNIILIAEKPENEESKSNKKNSLYGALAILGLLYIPSILINGFYFATIPFLIIVLLGVYLSVEAISSELGIATKLSKAVCGATVNTDCSALINSTKSKLLDIISFTDVSITFFVAQLLGLLFFSLSGLMNEFYMLTLISLLFSLPATFYSFYLQKFVAKKWCPICISIIALLYLETIGVLLFNDIHFSITIPSFLYFALALIISLFSSLSFKKLLKNNFELKSKIAESNRFKRNYTFFKMALLAPGKINTTANIPAGDIILGNPDAKLKIVLITSPYCSYCSGAHEIMENILALHKNKVAIHIRFNVNPIYAEEKGLLVIYKLIDIYFNKGQDLFMKAMHTWFLNKDETVLNTFDDTTNPQINKFQLLLDQYVWNQKNNTVYTPAFIINDYFFPSQYSRNDLIHFINDLEDDESFHN
jgi:uncharacterized membrane protein